MRGDVFRNFDAQTPWWVKLLVPILMSAILSGSLTYFSTTAHNDRDLVQRVSALESHHQDDTNRLDRIEAKLDRLMDWALGKAR